MLRDDTPARNEAGEACFLSNLDLIEKAIAFVCRRNHLSADQAEEFSAHVKFKLIERDYTALTTFEGRSSLRTFLTVVIQRLFLDYRTSLWGKWRPSAEARRAGPLGVEFETLTSRDGRSFDDACQLLADRHGSSVNRADLERLAARLPLRSPRRFESDDVLLEHPDRTPSPDALAIANEQQSVVALVSTTLSGAVARLSDQDRAIVMLHFFDGRTVAETARVLNLDQKRLYRQIARVLGELRLDLEQRGLGASALDLLQDRLGAFVWSAEAKATEKYVPRPSMVNEAER